MRMEHQFTVPVPVEVAWTALIDPERVAPCMPGATLTKAEGNEFEGSVKVKLGPVSLLYKGSGSFTDVDAELRRVVIDASGKDAKGNGTAAASVTAVLSSSGSATAVSVVTDLKVTGRPAQLGRGMISDVAGKILNQFAECLAGQLTAGEASGEQEVAAGSSPTGRSMGSDNGVASGESMAASTAAESRARHPSGAARPASWQVTPPRPRNGEATATESVTEASTEVPVSTDGPAVMPTSEQPASENEINLLDTAMVPVLKRLVPALAVLVAVGVAFSVLRRRARRRRVTRIRARSHL